MFTLVRSYRRSQECIWLNWNERLKTMDTSNFRIEELEADAKQHLKIISINGGSRIGSLVTLGRKLYPHDYNRQRRKVFHLELLHYSQVFPQVFLHLQHLKYQSILNYEDYKRRSHCEILRVPVSIVIFISIHQYSGNSVQFNSNSVCVSI